VRNPTFVVLSDGTVRNIYDVRLLNKLGDDRAFTLSLVSDQPLDITLEGADLDIVTVPANETMLQRVYVSAAPGTPAASADRTDLRFWVEDDGPGIPPELHEDAVNPFVRLDPARNQDKGSGVGLGLAIVSDVARSHGGVLRLGKSTVLGGLKAELVISR